MKKLLVAAAAAMGLMFVFGGNSAQAGHFHGPSYGCAPAYGYSAGFHRVSPIYASPYIYAQPRFYGGFIGGQLHHGHHLHDLHHHGHHHHRRSVRGIHIHF